MADKRLLKVAVPSGIGDISWVYSKLHCAPPEWEFEINVVDGWPHRSVEFCRLLPRVVKSQYMKITYDQIVVFQEKHKLTTFDRVSTCGFDQVMLSANLHLEAGRRLEDWLPDLPTEFHYKLRTDTYDAFVAADLLRGVGIGKRLLGISAASYRGSEAWDTWRVDRWMRFLDLLQEEAGGTLYFVLMGGFWDDLTFALSKRPDSTEMVGKTSIGQAWEMLNMLGGYMGFSSGLGVMSTLLRKPTFLLWPNHQIELSTSWAPPEMLRSHEYMMGRWVEPFEVASVANLWVKRFVKEAGDAAH